MLRRPEQTGIGPVLRDRKRPVHDHCRESRQERERDQQRGRAWATPPRLAKAEADRQEQQREHWHEVSGTPPERAPLALCGDHRDIASGAGEAGNRDAACAFRDAARHETRREHREEHDRCKKD